MKLSTSTHFRLAGEHDMAMRSAAFLSAIKKGAHFIFQANPGKENVPNGYLIIPMRNIAIKK